MTKPKISTLLNEHKKATVAAAMALVVFVVFSVTMFTHTHSAMEEEASQESSTTETEDSTQADLIDAQEDAIAEANALLSDEQKEKRDSYDADTKEFISILEAQLWGVGTTYISFTDTTFTESSEDGTSDVVAYVVDAMKKNTVQAADPQTVTYTAAIETAADSFFVELTQETHADGSVNYAVASDAFSASNDAYTPVSPSESFKVSGLNQEVMELLDNNSDGLNTAISNYCAQYFPTARNLTWTNYASIDWDTNQVMITFMNSETNRECLAVVYDRSAKSFTVNAI